MKNNVNNKRKKRKRNKLKCNNKMRKASCLEKEHQSDKQIKMESKYNQMNMEIELRIIQILQYSSLIIINHNNRNWVQDLMSQNSIKKNNKD